jgi:hypothetical protein
MTNNQKVSQQVTWNPSRFIGFSREQLELIKKGFDFALNEVYEIESNLQSEVQDA